MIRHGCSRLPYECCPAVVGLGWDSGPVDSVQISVCGGGWSTMRDTSGTPVLPRDKCTDNFFNVPPRLYSPTGPAPLGQTMSLFWPCPNHRFWFGGTTLQSCVTRDLRPLTLRRSRQIRASPTRPNPSSRGNHRHGSPNRLRSLNMSYLHAHYGIQRGHIIIHHSA